MKAPSILLTVLTSFALLPITPAQAQSTLPTLRTLAQVDLLTEPSTLNFVPPALPDRGRPTGRSEGGASRGSCNITGQPPLTALVPVEETAEAGESSEQPIPSTESVFSLTTKEQPSFWFYVPYPLDTTPLEFVLQDDQGNTLYQERFSSQTSGDGIVQITLPETAPKLQQNEIYRWFFLAYCDQDTPSFVEGWTQRSPLSPALREKLSAATLREQARLYAENGIWQETLTLTGENYRANPDSPEIAMDWASLLASANLSQLREIQIAPCCSPVE
ncbi:MAG: DUF928 domain-containing protein [Cyanobacteria bacterium J06554_11]